jgi:hypothetical protein
VFSCLGVITPKEQKGCKLNKKGHPLGQPFNMNILNRSYAGLAACTIATEASAHITTTPGRCTGGKCSCNCESKGEDHDNLSHFKRYLNVKVDCLAEDLGPGNSEEGIRM